jgi:hypothetical protein
MLRNTLALMILAFVSLSAFSGAIHSPSRLKREAHSSPQKLPSRADAEKIDLHIVGEVWGEKTFEQDIGHDLLFKLVPPEGGENAGWMVEIVPKTEPEDGPVEFSAIATPPYHAYNERCIATVYGRSAADVVNLKDRRFFFVQSIDDEHRAEEVVNAALYPTNVSDEDKVRIVEEQREIRLGKGELRILKSRTGHKISDLGTIDSLRFELDIQFSSGITMANIIARVAHPQ